MSLLARDMPSTKAFKGIITFAGRHQGTECSLMASETAMGKVVHTSHGQEHSNCSG